LKDKILNIWYPVGAGGNFLKLVLSFDGIPADVTKAEFTDMVNKYIENESYGTKSFDRFWKQDKLSKEDCALTVEQIKMIKTGKKIVWANHFDIFNSKAYEVLKLNNHIVITATKEETLAKIYKRIPKTRNELCKNQICETTNLTLNKVISKYIDQLFDNVLIVEYEELLSKESITKLVSKINEQFDWNVDIKDVDRVIDFWLNDFTKIKQNT